MLVKDEPRDKDFACVFFNVSWDVIMSNGREMGPTLYRPHLRSLESILTVGRFRHKGGTFSSVLLRYLCAECQH